MRKPLFVAMLAGIGYLLFVVLATLGTPSVQAAPPADPPGAPPPQAVASASPASSSPAPTASPVEAPIRNVVLILADDLDTALFDAIPRLAALREQGLSFTQQTVTDSLCCPSRVSIMRSQYLHNHKVMSNTYATGGGWPTFRDLGEDEECLPVWLQGSGVRTALIGKYLNDYPQTEREQTLVPPGWDRWVVPISRGETYKGYDYTLNIDGKLQKRGDAPADYLNDVLTAQAVDFIAGASTPFFLQLSVYNPHQPSPVAPRHKSLYRDAAVPRTAAYNSAGVNGPKWQEKRKEIKPWRLERMDKLWGKRMRSTESVADSVEAVQAALKASGRADDTLIIITSDNGFHLASHRLPKGKRAPYRTDTVVPMVMIGPGVAAGAEIGQMTSGIDLAPTIAELLGADVPGWIDGRSLTPFIRSGIPQADWRTGVLSESFGNTVKGDPDFDVFAPPHFASLRTPQWLYVEYETGERALYDLVADPDEVVNVVDSADAKTVEQLARQLAALKACSGPSCRVADRLPN